MKINVWRQIQQKLKMERDLLNPEWADRLESFSEELMTVCGEELTLPRRVTVRAEALEARIPFTLRQAQGQRNSRVISNQDFVHITLSNYIGWFLKSRHAGVYLRKEDWFECVASFQSSTRRIPVESPVAEWIALNGPLIRLKLTLKGLSAQESEALLHQLESLDAFLIIPISFNDSLVGMILTGPTLCGADNTERAALDLSLYGMELLGALDRQRAGELSRAVL